MSRVFTVVATIRTEADLERVRAAFLGVVEVPLEEYDTELVGCDWAPDVATIADAVNLLDGETEVELIDLNPARIHPAETAPASVDAADYYGWGER